MAVGRPQKSLSGVPSLCNRGRRTDARTKPVMIDDLAEAIASGALLLHSSALVDECLTYVVTD